MASVSDSSYVPSWYKPFDYIAFYGADNINYYKQTSFPTVLNQTEWDGNYEPDMKGYDMEFWWGTQLFPSNDCVASALASCMQILTYLATGVKEKFSVVWLHGNQPGAYSNSIVPIPPGTTDNGGKGAYNDDELNNLVSYGAVPFSKVYPSICPYANLQYDTDPAYTGMTAKGIVNSYWSDLVPHANRYRLSSWSTMNKTDINTIRQCILSYGCCMLNVSDGSDFNYVGSDGIVPDTGTTGAMGHDVCVIGWNTFGGINYWMFVNSWGNWGHNGGNGNLDDYGYIAYNHSKISYLYKLIPNISSTVEWDSLKVSGQPVYINALEWMRMMQRLQFKFSQHGITWSPYESYRHQYCYAYAYNLAINKINSSFGLTYPTVLSGQQIAAKHLNDLRDVINSIS